MNPSESEQTAAFDRQAFEKVVALYNKHNQFDAENGMRLEVLAPGEVRYEMLVEEKHTSSPGHCHGGALAGLMDSVLGSSALTYAFTQGNLCATVEFKINYCQPAHLKDTLVAVARIDHAGKRLIVCSGEIRLKTDGTLIAKGLGTFNLYPMNKKEFLWV
ncbi:PaaI family thioesterase [Hugenholtzia roseola]|uniref:PaaI family thioesterase n=1 Tax=Hugenholtzia roseola TaxID=1002 RepID=UPI0003F603C4|nr:PaaI family thioesterase [Hugenholtzia roseola]